MPTRLERISNRYLRPNQRWRCGRAIDGKQCLEGPNQNGQCPKISEPCQPTLGIRFKKRRITLWLLLVLLASIGILANQSSVLKLLSPGKLSASHGEVAGCTNCHGAPEHSFFQWIGKIFIEPGFDDNSRCLECHKIEQNAFNPHTTSLALLNQSKPEKITESAINWKLLGASKLTAPNKDSNGEVDCASCHKEHKGESASVRQFNPERCQLCHSNKFDDIENGHPSYQSYPYKRRTRIQFDHSSHLNSYFFKEDLIDIAPLGCKQCHDTDQSGEWMLSAGFEQSCSTCHLGEILGTGRATTKGIPVLVIPDLDLETLHQHGLNVGEWPQWADGEFSPMMRLLLQNGDPKIKHLLEDSDLELFDLSTVESEQLETITNLAWLIKELLFDVQTGGTERLKQQFRRTIQSPLNDVQVLGLISSLPRDTLVKNQEQWFPGLLDEIPAFRAGKINIFQPLSNSTPEPDQETDLEQTEQIDQSKLVGQKPRIKQAESCAPPESIAKSAAADTAKTDPSLSNSYYPAIETNPISTVNSASWNTSGEWSQSGSELRYRAVQHMDEFVKAWMDVSSAVDISYATGFTAHLPDNGVVYMCLECHTREPGDEINWRGLRPTNSRKNTGNFSHNIHYSLMTDDGCESCHILNPDEIASFGNMDKNTCGQCHQPGRAPAKCSICHDQLFANENQAHPEFVNYPHSQTNQDTV